MSAELVPTTPDESALERDPVGYMAVVLNRAKGWLTEAQSIEDVRNTKAIAVGYESVIREKELAFDAQLSAMEIVRRCERRIGELIREGQREGTIAKTGDIGRSAKGDRRGDHLIRPHEALGQPNRAPQLAHEHYAIADASAEQFEQAVTQAREEGNLSRANVVRKVKGETTVNAAPAARTFNPSIETGRGRQQINAAKERIERAVGTCNGIARGFGELRPDLAVMVADEDETRGWLAALKEAKAAITQLERRLKESM